MRPPVANASLLATRPLEGASPIRRWVGRARTWLGRARRQVATAFIVALGVHLLLLGAYLWSRGGQTTVVRVEAHGNTFLAFVDGRLHAKATFHAPARGGVSLSTEWTGVVPSLPEPRGIDWVRVTDLSSGRLLFEDDFDRDPATIWPEVHGGFRIRDGVLESDGNGFIAQTPRAWSDYAVEVGYQNITGATVSVRVQEPGTEVAFHLRPFRNYDSGLTLLKEGEAVTFAPGARVEPKRSETLKSIVQMTLRGYPLVMLALAPALAAAGALLMGGQGARECARLVRARLARFPRPWPGKTRGVPVVQRLSGVPARLAATTPWLLALTFAGGAFAIAVYLNTVYLDRMPHVQDSVAYVFQAKIFVSGRLAAPPPPVADAFDFEIPPFMVVSDGKWASVYPFGHPLALAVGARLGAMWLVPPLLGGATVLMVFALGRKLYGVRVGLLAALLLAVSPFFLMTASNFMSHNTAAFYLVGALLALALSDRRPFLFGCLAGLAFGLLFNTRPLDAVAFVPTFGLLLLGDAWPRAKRRAGVQRLAGVALGGLLMALAYLGYNWATTGDPLTSGFAASSYNISLGFGGEHTVVLGIQNVQVQMAALALVLHGWPQYVGIALVLLPFLLGTRRRWDWLLLFGAISLIAAYVFFIGHGIMYGPRYWYPSAPLFVLLTARGVDRAAVLLADGARGLWRTLAGVEVRERWPGVVVAYALALCLVGAGMYSWLLGREQDWHMDFVPKSASDLQSFNGVDDRLVGVIREADLTNALVLVEDPCTWQCYGSVFWLNAPTLDGDVVIAKDLPDRRAELFDAYPNRRVYRATYGEPSLLPYGTTGGAAARREAPRARDIVVPTPTPTLAPPTPEPAEIARRDAQRRADLATIAAGLQRYYRRHGAYPVALGVQSFCVYRGLDAGCNVAEVLDPIPQDPSGASPYWYLSDGATFTLFAVTEGPPGRSQCPRPLPLTFEAVANRVYCLQGRPGR